MRLAKFDNLGNEAVLSISATEVQIQEALAALVSTEDAVILYGDDGIDIQAAQCQGGSPKFMLNLGNSDGDCFDIPGYVNGLPDVAKAFAYFFEGDLRLHTEFNWSLFIDHYDEPLDLQKELKRALTELQAPPAPTVEKKNISAWNDTLKTLVGQIASHQETLDRKRSQFRYKDDYDIFHNEKWSKEVDYFWQNVIEKQVSTLRDLPPELLEPLVIVDLLLDILPQLHVNRPCANELDPREYEKHCAELLNQAGWQTRLTPVTGDQGTDIVAIRDGLSVAIQCKKYSSPVGNAAVQEIIAGRVFEKTRFAVVVATMGFTAHARRLADSAGVLLLHHDELPGLNKMLDALRLSEY